jgi:hypothetical protein
VGDQRNAHVLWLQNLKERDRLKEPEVGEKIILKWLLNTIEGHELD